MAEALPVSNAPARGRQLPSVRVLAARLRDLNDAFDGAGTVALSYHDSDGLGAKWHIIMADEPDAFGAEEVPGDGRAFDATAAARRLLAAARDGCAAPRSVSMPVRMEVTVRRYYGAGLSDLRTVTCQANRLRDAPDAAAQELGFPDWDRYSHWCGMEEPRILCVRKLHSTRGRH